MDQVADQVGTQGLPTVFYGYNHLYIVNDALNICLDFNSIDALSYSAYQTQKMFAKNAPAVEEQVSFDEIEKLLLEKSGLKANEKEFNMIDVVPEVVKVQQASHWKNKDTSKIKDF